MCVEPHLLFERLQVELHEIGETALQHEIRHPAPRARTWILPDSPLEESGFEPSVPLAKEYLISPTKRRSACHGGPAVRIPLIAAPMRVGLMRKYDPITLQNATWWGTARQVRLRG
jgi:hypothetical protein